MLDFKSMNINQKLAYFRKLNNMRQDDVAKKLNMPVSTYSRMEREGNLSVDFIFRVAEALGISPDLILYGEDRSGFKSTEPERKESDLPYDFSQRERVAVAKQSYPTPQAYENLNVPKIEQALSLLLTFSKKDKERVFEFINQINNEKR